MADVGNFFCNYEPLTKDSVRQEIANIIEFEQYSAPMQNRLARFVENEGSDFVVSSAQPRLVDGKPSKNPRYLQDRPDLSNGFDRYVAYRGMQLFRAAKNDQTVPIPVNAILSGRRNNPPDLEAKIRPLAVYNPIHYQELPELLMDYVCSFTGKSPSTTGAGSEGALTKGPFNALNMCYDLNATVVSMILTGLGGFSTAAGISVPISKSGTTLVCLFPRSVSTPTGGTLSRGDDSGWYVGESERLEHDGVTIPASRLGYRITDKFVRSYFGRVFDNPRRVSKSEFCVLRSKTSTPISMVCCYIAESQKKVAEMYMQDGSYEIACPPLQAVLKIMVDGHWNGHTIDAPEVRNLFCRDAMLQSDWYRRRLIAKQKVDIRLWSRHVDYLTEYCSRPTTSL